MGQTELVLEGSIESKEDDVLLDEIVQIEDQAPHLIGERFAVIKERHPDDWYEKCTTFCEQIGKKPWGKRHIQNMMNYSLFITNTITNLGSQLPPEKHVRPLTALPAIAQKEVWEKICPNGDLPDKEVIKEAREKWNVQNVQPKTKKGAPDKRVFNFTSDMVDWARWTWNPVFGCKHGCKYCYAADIAHRFGKNFQKPELMMHRLSAPRLTVIPKSKENVEGIRNVFVCSMSDLFGEWVPEDWIEKVFRTCRDNPQWNYIFLTKNPKRLVKYTWEDNWWVGTTIDEQKRVAIAETSFRDLEAKIKFVSLEPFNEHITFSDMSVFNWLIIGGRSRSTRMPAFQPNFEWVSDVMKQARDNDIPIYCKPNLQPIQPKEWPSESHL